MVKTTKGEWMKKLLFVLLCCSGCSHFTTTQQDLNYENGQPVRKITTRASAYTFFDAKSSLASFKASQTDKTQGASVGQLNQESTGTNSVESIKAVTELLKVIK